MAMRNIYYLPKKISLYFIQNYEEQTITARNGNGQVVDVNVPKDLILVNIYTVELFINLIILSVTA